MVVGDERSIDSEFPETWHEPRSLRGVPCRCDIKVNELFEWDLPQVRLPCVIMLCSASPANPAVDSGCAFFRITARLVAKFNALAGG